MVAAPAHSVVTVEWVDAAMRSTCRLLREGVASVVLSGVEEGCQLSERVGHMDGFVGLVSHDALLFQCIEHVD